MDMEKTPILRRDINMSTLVMIYSVDFDFFTAHNTDTIIIAFINNCNPERF